MAGTFHVTSPPRRAHSAGVGRLLFWGALLAAVVVALGVASFPARQILSQQGATAAAAQQVVALDTEIARLDKRVASLEDPEEIKRIAKDRFDLVAPGQESYRVVFPPIGVVPTPRGWPFLLPAS